MNVMGTRLWCVGNASASALLQGKWEGWGGRRGKRRKKNFRKRTESRAKQGGTSHVKSQSSPLSQPKTKTRTKVNVGAAPLPSSGLRQLLLPPSSSKLSRHQKSATHFPRDGAICYIDSQTRERDISSQKKAHLRHLFKFTYSSGSYQINKELWRKTEDLRFPGRRQGIVYQNKDGSIWVTRTSVN